MVPNGLTFLLTLVLLGGVSLPALAAPQIRTVETPAAGNAASPGVRRVPTGVDSFDRQTRPERVTQLSGKGYQNRSGGKLPDVLHLYPNQSKIIKVEGLKRISITNQNIADVLIVSPEEIMVLPNQAGVGGRTSAYVWDKDGRKEIRIIVIGRIEETAISDQIQKDINLDKVRVEFINNRIILKGSVRNHAERQYAQDIAGLYGNAILNLLEVEGLATDPKEALIKLLNLPDVKVTVVNTALQASTSDLAGVQRGGLGTAPVTGARPAPAPAAAAPNGTVPLYINQSVSARNAAGGASSGQAQIGASGVPTAQAPAPVMVLLEGTVDDERDRERADEITRAFFGANSVTGRGPQAVVINHIEVLRPVQVLVEGLLLELQHNNNRQMDFRWGNSPQAGTVAGQPLTRIPDQLPETSFNNLRFFETPVAQTLGGQFPYTGGEVGRGFWPPFPFPMQRLNRADPLLLQVQWALTNSKAKLIASPKIVARSGETATIDVGGTDPVQTAAGFGATGVQLIRSGTVMQITPVVDHRGNIDTSVDISVIDSQGNGNTRNRSTSTRVTVKDGQHIVVSGLVQENENVSISKVPFLGDIPFLGRLFQTKTRNTGQTETVAIITPRLLDAVEKELKFAGYGQTGPSAADLRSSNKGKSVVSRPTRTASAGTLRRPSAPISARDLANREIRRSRERTTSKVARHSPDNDVASGTTVGRAASHASAQPEQLSQAKSAGAAGSQDSRMKNRVRALFQKMKTGEETASSSSPNLRVARRIQRPTQSRRVEALEAPVPMMAESPFVEAQAARAAGASRQVPATAAQPATARWTPPHVEQRVDSVAARIDALFDEIDDDMEEQAN